MRPAEAWLQVAALALSAVSAFSKHGDGGVGAYLQNIKELSEENIRLTQRALIGIGEIQGQLETMPERLRLVFLEVKGYELKQGTQTSLDKLLLVESHFKKNGRLDSNDRRDCQWVVDKCAEMTGARSSPYGRGGTAAACIALIGSIEARASWFLRRTDNFRQRVSIAYLPWFDEIFLDQDGSLQRTFLTEGRELAGLSTSSLAGLPDGVKAALTPVWKTVISSDPGASKAEAALACGSYARLTRYQLGDCIDRICPGEPTSNSPEYEMLRRILKEQELSPAEVLEIEANNISLRANGAVADKKTFAAPKRSPCFCSQHARVPVYTPQTGAGLFVTVKNDMVNGVPQIGMTTEWRQQAPASCTVFVNGESAVTADQFAAARDSARGSDLTKSLDAFIAGELAKYNDQRAIVYTTYLLLDAASSAREQFKQVAK